jgi:hypothetical protein
VVEVDKDDVRIAVIEAARASSLAGAGKCQRHCIRICIRKGPTVE